MKKYIAKLSVLIGLLACMLLLVSMTAMAEDPISRNIEINPKVLTSTGSVRVSISLVNTSDDGGAISVTLLDPSGNVCTSFGSGGTANLSPGMASSYSGTWTVTQAQLEAGKIIYTAKYAVADENGTRVQVTRPITGNITHEKAVALLKVERFVEPGTKVMQGQTVTIRYSIKNVGTIPVQNITIKDPDITNEPVVLASLGVEEMDELSYSFVAGSTSKTSSAEISYEVEVNGELKKQDPMKANPQTIDVTVPNLVVQLTGKQIVNAGEKIDLTYVITNKSDLSYEQLKITDKLLGDIDSNLSVGAGKSLQDTKSITVNQSGTYQLTVTGVDSAGNNVIFQSNELTIQTTEAAVETSTIGVVPVVLDIVIEADRDVIYEQPSPIIFRVKVANNGAAKVSNVEIAAVGNVEGTRRKVAEIDAIEPGETVDMLVEVSGSIGGKYQFCAVAKDSNGEDSIIPSNVFTISYHQLATPPTPTPEPTQEPTEPPPAVETETPPPFTPPEEEGGIGSVLIYVLGGLLGVIVVAVGVLFFLDSRRSAPRGGGGGGSGRAQVKVIDTIERTPHRDYTRAPKKGVVGNKGSAPAPAPAAPPPVAAPVRADVEEEPYDPYDVPMEAVERERAAMQAEQAGPASQPVEIIDPPAAERPAREPAAQEEANPYRRPAPVEEPAPIVLSGEDDDPDDTPPASPRTVRRQAAEMGTMENTSVYQSDYLSRIREPSGRAAAPEDDEDAAEPRKTLSEEEAALLSGSTGQYRLSKRAGATPGRERPTARRVEEAEDFARQQRAERGKPQQRDADFYDDEDDDPPTTTRRRRR